MRFQAIIGQQEIKNRLIRTVKNNRVSHAQMFLGPEGSGKLSLAIAYAQFINCTNKQENDSCGQCPSCIKYEKLVHPDLHFLYPTARTSGIEKPVSTDFLNQWRELCLLREGYFNLTDWHEAIGIEKKRAIINTRDCNSLISTLSYKSYEAEYKVMIIWMAEKIFHAAAPKILKILEEPPEKTLFILIVENSEQILNTILSRTQILKIPPISRDDLSLSLSNRGFDPARVNDAVRVSNGNYREALQTVSGSTDDSKINAWFVNWMRACYKGNVKELMNFISPFAKNSRDTQKIFLLYSLRMLR